MSKKPSDMTPEERRELILEYTGKSAPYLIQLKAKLAQALTFVRQGHAASDADVEEMIQVAHTIHKMASCVALDKTVAVARAMEKMVLNIHDGTVAFSVEIGKALTEACAVVSALADGLRSVNEEKIDVEKVVQELWRLMSPAKPSAKISGRDKEDGEKAGDYPEIDEKYLQVYIEDTQQNIEKFNEGLVDLERNLNDKENIDNLFRLIHTIKGSSGMVNVQPVQEVAHKMENILSAVRDRREAFADMFAVLFKGIDAIDVLVRMLKKDKRATKDVSPVIKGLDDYFSGLPAVVKKAQEETQGRIIQAQDLLEIVRRSTQKKDLLRKAVDEGGEVFRLVFAVRAEIPMKSMKAYLVGERLKDEGAVLLMAPDPESVNDAACKSIEFTVLYCAAKTIKEVRAFISLDGVDILSVDQIGAGEVGKVLTRDAEALDAPGGQADYSVPQESSPPSAPHGENAAEAVTVRVDAKKLDVLMNLSGELITVRARLGNILKLIYGEAVLQKNVQHAFEGIELSHDQLSRQWEEADLSSPNNEHVKRAAQSIKKFCRYIDEAGRQAAQGRLWQQMGLLDEAVGGLNKLTADIQAGVMQVRMVPVKGVFSRFRRIVRDISSDIGKQVSLVVEGEETELDKNLVDNLGDPLTHMVRNAIDHGIEDPEIRRQLGKPPQGTVTLSAYHQGNSVCIEVSDDGKGLDPQAITNAAVEKKLITRKQAAQMTDKEKLDLMFKPGFSTAQKVTGLSGRGVGLDVVRNMITAINGIIDIKTDAGQGTTFILKIPLTLAIIQALLIENGSEIYAMPVDAVIEIIQVDESMMYSVDGTKTVKLRDHALSLITLEDTIKVKGPDGSGSPIKCVVVISDGENRAGIIVERLIGESEIVIKSLTHHFSRVKGIAGATILGNGQISLILDPQMIIMGARQ